MLMGLTGNAQAHAHHRISAKNTQRQSQWGLLRSSFTGVAAATARLSLIVPAWLHMYFPQETSCLTVTPTIAQMTDAILRHPHPLPSGTFARVLTDPRRPPCCAASSLAALLDARSGS